MIKRNISISYILAFSKNTWFWLGIWIFYYLRFTNYAGIGIIETILIVTMTASEIPTGAIADLLGKKNTLVAAFFFEAVGGFMMALAPNFSILALSVFVMCIGGAFYSGTIEALVYDTLKQEGKEGVYDRKISNINTISLITPAICGAIGGYLYKLDPTLPFYANAFGYMIGFFASFLLIEPDVDTDKFSFCNFFKQTKQGIKQLFGMQSVRKLTMLLLTISSILLIFYEMLDSFLAFEFGFSEIQQGWLWSAIFIISALASQATPVLRKYFNDAHLIFILGLVAITTILISPVAGLFIGGFALIARSSLQGILGALSSTLINNNTESKFRATTISTFNMIKNIPYVAGAYILGRLSDAFSARILSFYLGLALLIMLLLQVGVVSKKVKH